MPKDGFKAEAVVNDTDETVIVISGQLNVISEKENWNTRIMEAGDLYHAAAGEKFSVEAMEDTVAICIYSVGENGKLPDDD